ncbi:MAG: alpha/beta hydrolase [Synechococcales bacterium]|nr:alpha/beta hydrolase [Synechococcales bacterium]
MPIVDVTGVPHGYDLTPATAEPLVLFFVHGWMLSRVYWQPVLAELTSTYRCLTYDLRGFGESRPCTTPNACYSLQTYAQDLLHLLDRL